ncbi:translation initiation factor IF-3, mitochondrial [Pelodytes ibericus]
MSGLHLRKLICQVANNGKWHLGRHFGLSSQCFKMTTFLPLNSMTWIRKGPPTIHAKVYSTAEQDEESDEKPNKKKKNSAKFFGNIGRKIPYRLIHVFNDSGEDLGNMHRMDVIRLMDEQGLKLVPIKENADPPVYKLLTGKQMHEEQLKLREKEKLSSSNGPVQIKELSFSVTIAKHDLEVKLKQITHWIEKKHHVRITVQRGDSEVGSDKLELLNQINESMLKHATCVYNPKLIKDGRAAVCVLRPLSKKELQEQAKTDKMQRSVDLSKVEDGNQGNH